MKTLLRVDPIACDGHGLCAELVPESVRLDDWGYPIVIGPVPVDALVHAQRAVRECPKLALRLERVDVDVRQRPARRAR